MRKSDLKNGMIVETRFGDKYLVHNNKLLNSKGYGFMYLNDDGFDFYTDDMKYEQNRDYDIMYVYNSNPPSLDNLFDEKLLTLIWERKEEIKVQNTVKIINAGSQYTTYSQWVVKNVTNKEYKLRFDYGFDITKDEEYKDKKYIVLAIAEHSAFDNEKLAYIQDLKTERCYLFSLDALEDVYCN